MLEARLLERTEIDDAKWDGFVEASPQSSIYGRTWYLDSVCPGWGAIVVKKGNEWQAVLPMNIHRKRMVNYSLAPLFTQFIGVLFSPAGNSKNRVYHREKKILNKIIETIPSGVRLFDHNFHPSLDYLLPFYWKGFEISPRYSYVLDLSPGYEAIESRLTDSIKSDLKLSAKEGLQIEESSSIDTLCGLLKGRGLISNQDEARLKTLWGKIIDRRSGTILHAKDKDGKVLCAAAFLFDQEEMIYLLSSSVSGPGKGSNSMILMKAIAMCYDLGIKTFDFEGSMIESVENYFRAFNPEKRIYYRVRRDRLPLLHRMIYSIKRKELK